MKAVLLVVGWYAVLSVVILGGIGLTVGFPETRHGYAVDEQRFPRMSQEEMALGALVEAGLPVFGYGPRLVILGASGASRAFAPRLVQDKLPGHDVSNLAIPGTRISDAEQILDDVISAAPPRALQQSVVVLGVTCMCFWHDMLPSEVEPTPWWLGAARPRTLVGRATARGPAILDVRNPVRKVLPRAVVRVAKARLRIWRQLTSVVPSHPGEWLAHWDAWRLQTPAFRWTRRTQEAETSRPPIDQQMDWLLSQGHRFGNPFDPRQFERFSALVRRAVACGMKVVVIDMPLHSVHLGHEVFFSPCRERLADEVAALRHMSPSSDRSIHLLDLTDAVADEHFADLAHAGMNSRQPWVDVLVDRLRPLLEIDEHQDDGNETSDEE